MKASELRIGNLVDLGNRIAKVIEINHLACVVVDLEETQDTIEDYERVKPIKLTEEWLLKFGLKPNQWFCSNSYCVVEDKTGDIHYGWCMKTQNSLHTKEIEFGYFKYVHQFQNLYFAIIGEELILKE
jgi:hypothetical protein